MNNSILLDPMPADKPLVGKSHWWGAPDLPDGVPYPYVMVHDYAAGDDYAEPLTFICQIRLDEVAPLDPDGLLPHKGMLYFFAAIDYFLGEDSPLELPLHGAAGDMVRVVYVEDVPDDLRPYVMCWEGTDESVFRPAEALRLSGGPLDADGLSMLSVPYHDEVADAWPGYVSLLQIEECDRWGLRFFDCGTLYLLIHPDDLRARRFDRIMCDVFTY